MDFLLQQTQFAPCSFLFPLIVGTPLPGLSRLSEPLLSFICLRTPPLTLLRTPAFIPYDLLPLPFYAANNCQQPPARKRTHFARNKIGYRFCHILSHLSLCRTLLSPLPFCSHYLHPAAAIFLISYQILLKPIHSRPPLLPSCSQNSSSLCFQPPSCMGDLQKQTC